MRLERPELREVSEPGQAVALEELDPPAEQDPWARAVAPGARVLLVRVVQQERPTGAARARRVSRALEARRALRVRPRVRRVPMEALELPVRLGQAVWWARVEAPEQVETAEQAEGWDLRVEQV